jgi:HSP20 family protein
MSVTKFHPLSRDPFFPAFRGFEDVVSQFLQQPASERPWAPPVDIVENESELVVKADLPEVKLEDVHIHLENGTLSIEGERKFEKSEEKEGFHIMERSYGSFSRRFTVPDTVDPEKVSANLAHGVLTVKLPKKELAKPRTIKVALGNGN